MRQLVSRDFLAQKSILLKYLIDFAVLYYDKNGFFTYRTAQE